MAIEAAHRRFTVSDYHQMAATGILAEDDRVELIDGEILEMTPTGGRHVGCVNRLTRLLGRQVGDDAYVSIQNPVQLGEYDEPQPDVAVIRAREYGDQLPTAADVLLLIEISNTSLNFDRNTRLRLYARAGIAEVWIVDVRDEAIERHTNPSGDTFRVAVRVGRGEEIASTAVPGLRMTVEDVLG